MTIQRPVFRIWLLAALFALVVGVQSASADLQYKGVMLHSLWGDSSNDDMDHELDMAKAAGSNVVRVDVAWSSLETGGKGQMSDWYVQKLDRFVNGADSRGIKVLINLWSTPCWASTAPDSAKQGCNGSWWDRGVTQYAPSNPADFGDIGKYIANRYGDKLAAIEIWNEPNHPSQQFWKANGDLATAYANLAKGAYPVIKQGNANLPVITGSLSGTDTTFLKGMYAAGIKDFSDGIAVHPYNDGRGFPGLVAFHAAMVAAGDNDPVWVTEFGWPTGADPQWHVSDSDQASDIKNGFADLNALPWVKLASLYNLRDKGTNPSDMENNFGIVKRDYTPKAGYQALSLGISGQGATPVTVNPTQAAKDAAGSDADKKAGAKGAKDGNGPDSTNADPNATNDANTAANAVKLKVALSAPGKTALAATGQLTGQKAGTVTLTVNRVAPSGRLVKFATKTITVRKGRFKAKVARYLKGKYQLTAKLKGTKISAKTGKKGVANEGDDTGPAQEVTGDEGSSSSELPEGVVNDGQVADSANAGGGGSPSIQVSSDMIEDVDPGPLTTGGLIQAGDSDKANVELVQRRLAASGYNVKVDGDFSNALVEKIKVFQADQDLQVDGIVGRQTMASLLSL